MQEEGVTFSISQQYLVKVCTQANSSSGFEFTLCCKLHQKFSNPASPNFQFWSVVLPYVAIRLLEQLLVSMQLVLEQRLAQCLLDFAFTGQCILPTWESN